jgi:phage-related protein (TIGR01555 family)
MQQFDTALADLDSVIMSQYQLVAAASNIPATKLLGTTPKGFNATGEYDESSYHEELKSVQIHSLTQFLERHHLLLIQSEIVPEFGVKPFELTVMWNPTDAMTNKEQAELNKLEAETGQILINAGAIDGTDERARIIANPDSGYNGLIDEDMELPPIEEIQSNPEET